MDGNAVVDRCPPYPQKQTFAKANTMSALCQKWTHALQQEPALRKRQPWQCWSRQSNIACRHQRRSRVDFLARFLEDDQEGTLVSMIGSWGSPEKAAIEALVVGI